MFLNLLPMALRWMVIYNRFIFLKELHWSVQLQQDVGVLELNICSVSYAEGNPIAVRRSGLLLC